MKKVMTPLEDYEFAYHIFAYRKLTREECIQAQAEYMKNPKHKSPQAGKIIEIYTEIQ